MKGGAEVELRTETACGSFGDRRVNLYYFSGSAVTQSPVILLFHGVHGWAAPVEGNKYGYIARELAGKGIETCIAESSRLRRDRETFGDDRAAWAKEAFRGKTFAMEVYDACSAFAAVQSKYPGRPVVPGGFSLGGLTAGLLAGGETDHLVDAAGRPHPGDAVPAGVIVSGSGESIRPEAAGSLSLPILDSLGENRYVLDAASKINTCFALFFYGSLDETFSEESSRSIYDRIPLREGKKRFIIIPGADHAFRQENGVPSRAPLERMAAIAMDILENC